MQFFPNPLIASVYPAKVLSIGQVALFSSNPSAHYGSARVLGRQAEVHFVPDSSGWYFSDGDTRTGSDASKSFDRAGVFQVSAFVDYSVRYRLLGETSWQRVPGKLTVASNTLEILVSATGIKDDKASKAGLLVGQDCIQNPGSFGCDT
ncbi:MAG: hypothetical protein F2609_00925 [Actinobacteria bacterium]|nr:hypothetical protein [Actinomycetota bacterium]